MNVYERRWNNAVRIANKINHLLEQGYIVYDSEGDRVRHSFQVSEEEILLPLSDNFKILYFLRDTELDNGAHTKISDYNDMFKNWMFVHPSNINLIDFTP